MTMTFKGAFLALLAGTCPSLALAQAERGVDVPPKVLAHDLSTTAAEHRTMTDKTMALMRRIHAKPAIASLDGFSLRTSLSASEVLENMPAGTPIGGRALTLLTLPSVDGDSECKSRDGAKASHCGPGLTLTVNDPMAALGRNDSNALLKVSLPMTPLPQRNGFDVVRIDDKVMLTKTRPGVPLFLPVTREQYVDELARDVEKAVAELRAAKVDATELQKTATGYRAQIAAMSPAERAERACSSDTLAAMFKPCMASDEYEARINPAYFDRKLGRASVQLITLTYTEADTPRDVVLDTAIRSLNADELPLD